MQVCYKSYMEFLLKADLLTHELALTPAEAAELLAKLSGYKSHCTMPVGQEYGGSFPSREDLVNRLLAMRPDISTKHACDIIIRLDLPLLASMPSAPSSSVQAVAQQTFKESYQR